MTIPTRKTYKREMTIGILIALYTFISYTLYNLAKLEQTDAMVDLVGILIIPTFATVAGAFGLDSYFKQHPKISDNKINDSEK